ncbi:MAG: ABC transporter permease, partial [Acidimicrobiales bacterium]
MILAIIENPFLSIISSAIPASTVVVLAATGCLLGERVGVLNLGQEGLIGIGAVYGVIAVQTWNVTSPWTALLIGMIAAGVAGVLFAIAVVVFRASQVLVGLALAIGGIGLSNQLGTNRTGTPIQVLFKEVNPGGVLDNNDFVEAFFFHDPVV